MAAEEGNGGPDVLPGPAPVAPPAGPGPRRARWAAGAALALPVLVGTAPFLLVAWVALNHVGRQGDLAGDYAYLELATRSAARGDALLGPYSRYGWNHPGPAMFYWSAPFYKAFRGSPESLGLAAAVLHTVAVGAGIAAAGRASGRRAAWVVAGVSLAVVQLWSYSFIDRIWNPYLVLTGIVATALLAAGALSGRRWQLVGVVVAASFTVQTHVGTAPIVGLVSAAVVVGLAWPVVRGREPWRPWVRPAAGATGAATLLWALPVGEQLTGHPGNLGQLVSWARTSGGSHGFGEVLDVVAVQLTMTKLRVLPNAVSATRPLPPATTGRVLLLLGLLAVVAWGIWGNRRAGRRFEQHLCTLALLGVVGVFVACMQVEGDLEGYLTLPASSIGAVLWTAALLTVTGELAGRSWAPAAAARRAVPVVLLVAAVWSVAWMARRHPEDSLQVRRTPDRQAAEVVGNLLGALPRDGSPVLLDPLGGTSASAAGTIANQLERAGIPIRTTSRWETFYGRDRRSDGCERAVVSVVPEARRDLIGDRDVAGWYGGQWVLVAPRPPDPGC